MMFKHLRSLALLSLASAAVPAGSEAATVYAYSGTLSASASAGTPDNQTVSVAAAPPNNYGAYTVTAHSHFQDTPPQPGFPCGIGGCRDAKATVSANLGPEAFSAAITADAFSYPFGSSASGGGGGTVDFSIAADTAWNFAVNLSAGGPRVSLYSFATASNVYLRDFTGLTYWPGVVFAESVPLKLLAGAYELKVSGGTFASQAGVSGPGYISVNATTPVPIPAAFWLFASALTAMGVGSRRRPKQA
ncbi:MAG: hypothetical protein PHE55_09055 [Methylococcaceae bacterium]|nr:hypothetical protein [Methylococcaceae bacterium]